MYPANVAPTSAQIHRDIAELLHKVGPLDYFAIANEIHQAPFRVRAELRVMRRYRLVQENITAHSHTWELTHAGHILAANADQLELEL